MDTDPNESNFYESLGVPEPEKENCCEIVHEKFDKNTKVLMAMMIGRPTGVDGVDYHHLLPACKSCKGYAKEIKPELKHLKAEILRRYRAHGTPLHWKEPRPAQWTHQKCLDWLKCHFIADEKNNNIVINDA